VPGRPLGIYPERLAVLPAHTKARARAKDEAIPSRAASAGTTLSKDRQVSILRAHQPAPALSAQEMIVKIGDPLAAGVG
jgi:hypothetical protein